MQFLHAVDQPPDKQDELTGTGLHSRHAQDGGVWVAVQSPSRVGSRKVGLAEATHGLDHPSART